MAPIGVWPIGPEQNPEDKKHLRISRRIVADIEGAGPTEGMPGRPQRAEPTRAPASKG